MGEDWWREWSLGSMPRLAPSVLLISMQRGKSRRGKLPWKIKAQLKVKPVQSTVGAINFNKYPIKFLDRQLMNLGEKWITWKNLAFLEPCWVMSSFNVLELNINFNLLTLPWVIWEIYGTWFYRVPCLLRGWKVSKQSWLKFTFIVHVLAENGSFLTTSYKWILLSWPEAASDLSWCFLVASISRD